IGTRYPRIEIVVIRQVCLYLVPHAGRNQQFVRKLDVALYKRPRFDLADMQKRVPLSDAEGGGYSLNVLGQRRERVGSQEIASIEGVVPVVIGLHACLKGEALRVVHQRIAEKIALAGVI